MKIYIKLLGLLLLAGVAFTTACDKVVFPNVIITDLDTNFFPGNFIDYEYPTFEENTNTFRNAVIADYTGHQCPFCPPAATAAEALADENPDRVFVATIHGSPEPGGSGVFQAVNEDFPRDFTNPQGLEMSAEFFSLGVGFSGNPRGNVNRVPRDDGFYFLPIAEWADKTDEVLASTLNVNIQAKSNYYPETSGVFLHVETDIINELEGNYNIVVYALENTFVSPQKMPDATTNETYVHHDIHIGNVFEEAWGRGIAADITPAGTKISTDFSYELPGGFTNEDMHFLVVVFNRDTYEIEQVIKHEF
ncbi:MAG: Omp28-related outer membrane protein [Crocinitomix sp.]|nr:Omp28-related outer membrane protein [Crocinitomix sp.]